MEQRPIIVGAQPSISQEQAMKEAYGVPSRTSAAQRQVCKQGSLKSEMRWLNWNDDLSSQCQLKEAI